LKYDIEKMLPIGYAIQGELVGPKIQNNHENVKENTLYVFDIWDIVNQKYLSSKERLDFMQTYFNNTVPHAPIVNEAIAIFKECEDISQMLKRVDGESINPGTISEGRMQHVKYLNKMGANITLKDNDCSF
jgi:ATP-dependent RNA circularization protein (DNA/RNA ligase family)